MGAKKGTIPYNKGKKTGNIRFSRPLCKCGCGGHVKDLGDRYINHHHLKGNNFSKNNKAWNKGLKHSPETIEKLKKAKIGYVPWNKGKRTADPSKVEAKRYVKYVIRTSEQYYNWRKNILKRDNYSCVICGVSKGWLQVDHFPKTFQQIIQEQNIQSFEEAMVCQAMWDENNGRTLCKACHEATPSWRNRWHGYDKLKRTHTFASTTDGVL